MPAAFHQHINLERRSQSLHNEVLISRVCAKDSAVSEERAEPSRNGILTLVIMHLGRIASIKHFVEFDNICIARGTLKHVAGAIEAQSQSVRWLDMNLLLAGRGLVGRGHCESATGDPGYAAVM